VLDATRRVTYLAELTERGLVRLGPVSHLLRECQLAGRTAVCSEMTGEVVVLRIGEGR
jgi:hypothetical protein